MKFLAIIPARYASTRFPGKPLAQLGGRPMIQWVYEKVASEIGDTWVATDDERIEAAVKGFGGRVVMTSPTHRSGTDRSAEACRKIVTETGTEYDVVVNVQGDEPFVSSEQLGTIRSLFDYSDTQIATLVKKFAIEEDIFNPNTPKVVLSAAGEALYFSRSVVPYLRGVEPAEWQSKHVYYKHIGLYAYSVGTLFDITSLPQSPLEMAESLEQLRWLESGYRIRAGVVTSESVAVDTPADLARAEEILLNSR
ncbi:MAG: 3-deoxy-manno-octulosonate cytidylyltransferase [Rikenellaceae bacterium]|jgi:3-deoxy-manno-octulosonate cytidylyltransferase (CMP-KDO synthetase)|nr:3-deoxy-manno-octulosonate cytidylyltransferase [Rikenellaceae bacterium]